MKWARPICLRLLVQLIAWLLSFALDNAGNNMAARMAMIAMTISNSINVNAGWTALVDFSKGLELRRIGMAGGLIVLNHLNVSSLLRKAQLLCPSQRFSV